MVLIYTILASVLSVCLDQPFEGEERGKGIQGRRRKKEFLSQEVGRKNTGRDSIAVIFAVNYISFSKVIYLLILELKIPVENKTLCDRIKKKGF